MLPQSSAKPEGVVGLLISFVVGELPRLCGALGGDRGAYCLFGGVNQGAEELDIESRGHAARGLPMNSHHDPIGDLRFVGFDGSVQGSRRGPEAFGQPVYRPAMFNVDHVAFPVDHLGHAVGYFV